MFPSEDAEAILVAYSVWRRLPNTDRANALYGAWWATPVAGFVANTQVSGAPPLEGALRVEHAGSRRWVNGCRVTGLGVAGAVVVTTPDGVSRALSQGDYWCPQRPGLPPRVGDEVVGVDRSGGYASEGWWRTWAGGWDLTRPAPDVSRAYLGLRPDGVLEAARHLPTALDRAGLPWTVKVAALEGMLSRRDAAVLYVRDGDRDLALRIVASVLAAAFRADGPLPFTRPVVPGLCWAEDPGGEESFGQTRCTLLDAAFATGGDPVRAAESTFVAAGIDPALPHLRTRS